ncbi:hypothetical protein [Nitrosospira sp. Nsp2]|uniref:hypothetical protein n=1 Tax=Nitrosospira sp. Nsp2 TaxID=136548 RepID=UPI000D31D938|nr:hypothetical protein [Nitrosospira sp. Nsp2]
MNVATATALVWPRKPLVSVPEITIEPPGGCVAVTAIDSAPLGNSVVSPIRVLIPGDPSALLAGRFSDPAL